MITLAYLLVAFPNQPQPFIPDQSSFPTWNQISPDGHLIITGVIVFGFMAMLLHYRKNGGKK